MGHGLGWRLHQQIITEQATEQSEDHMSWQNSDAHYGVSLQSGTCRPHSLQQIKERIPREMHHVVKLWDQDANDYTYGDQRIGELLSRDAMQRQGSPRGDPDCGDSLLRRATLDLSGIRSELHDDEILNAILEGNQNASPGPNGVMGYPYHTHASLLIPVFQEAFQDLLRGEDLPVPYTEGLMRPIGKCQNPSTFKQIRDLELPNFDRKVLERLFCLVIDERACDSLSSAQAACLKGRDVANHILQLNSVFEQALNDRELLAVLSLDCSKGFNRMSHSWVERVLRASGCPDFMIQAIMRMINPTVAYVVHNQKRVSRLSFECGLRQGGPLSALLYVICVDPLLCAFKTVPDVALVSGFVDDWLAATRCPSAIPVLQELCDIFARASGQIFNADKSVVLVSKVPSEAEVSIMQSRWTSCRIVLRHRIVGVLYGPDVRPAERYEDAMRKFDKRLEHLQSVRMSLNMRIVAANVLLLSHFSYLNRFFMMPEEVVSAVNVKVRQFITRISIGNINVWTHCLPIVKSKVALIDVRLLNVALLIGTAHKFAGNVPLASSLPARWQHSCFACMHASYSCFFQHVGESPQPTIAKGTRALYKRLLESELPGARAYLAGRMRSRGLSANELFENFNRISASATDHHRVHLLMWMLNGLATSHRVSVFRSDVNAVPCKLCGTASDDLMHLSQCSFVREVVRTWFIDT